VKQLAGFLYWLSDKCWGSQKKAWAQTANVGTTRRTMLAFFKAFSGRFSKYLFRKTLLHAQKVNSQLKSTTPDSYRQKHRKIHKKTYNCDTENVVSAVYCLSEVSLQRANFITSL